MKAKTRELTGPALDWAVSKCEGYEAAQIKGGGPVHLFRGVGYAPTPYQPSTDWAQGGPIIDRVGISIIRADDEYHMDAQGFCTNERIPAWFAREGQESTHSNYEGGSMVPTFMITERGGMYGPTPLVSAMRCYVALKLGDEVEVPEELLC